MHAADVGMVMLDGEEREAFFARPLLGPRSGEVAGVKIVNDGLGLDLEGAHEVIERLAKEVETGGRFKIAEMLALVGDASAGKGEDAFEMPAHGEQRRRLKRQARCRVERSRGRGE